MNNEQTSETAAQLRAIFETRRTQPYAWRVDQLTKLKAMIAEKEVEIFAALNADLGKPKFEAFLTETSGNISEIDHVLQHLERWMKPKRVSTPMSNQPGHSEIVPEPMGVVLIIGPWNYPFDLVVSPLVGAIAAGNCALLKPSELAPMTSALLARIVPEYLDRDAIRVIEGGVDVATDLLEQRFDHIFFTGSSRVGKIVMAAAAKHLTPVTLELGGKSPCIVNEDADLQVVARRVGWGKFVNAGQTCVAPDYVLAHENIVDQLINEIRIVVADFYGADTRSNPDYPRIINEHHFDRLTELMKSGDVVVGGDVDRAGRYIAPTVLTNVTPESPIMAEEIFGPLLPILPVCNVNEAIAFVNHRPKPLALYLFTHDEQARDKVVQETSSGGVCINDVVVHLAVPGLPFGGVGSSGMGAYHSRASFETFSHAKSVLTKWQHFEVPLRYPPYTESKLRWLRRLL